MKLLRILACQIFIFFRPPGGDSNTILLPSYISLINYTSQTNLPGNLCGGNTATISLAFAQNGSLQIANNNGAKQLAPNETSLLVPTDSTVIQSTVMENVANLNPNDNRSDNPLLLKVVDTSSMPETSNYPQEVSLQTNHTSFGSTSQIRGVKSIQEYTVPNSSATKAFIVQATTISGQAVIGSQKSQQEPEHLINYGNTSTHKPSTKDKGKIWSGICFKLFQVSKGS